MPEQSTDRVKHKQLSDCRKIAASEPVLTKIWKLGATYITSAEASASSLDPALSALFPELQQKPAKPSQDSVLTARNGTGMKEIASLSPESVAADPTFKRLHITPLDPDLLKIVIPAAVLPKAQNVSFHAIQTFPEKPFGFVDLPTAEADKIKKKLHGAILRGVKIRVEVARPHEMPRPAGEVALPKAEATENDKRSKKKDDSGKKRKREQEIPGVQLEEGRQVKRGWTVHDEVQNKKDRKKNRDKSKEDKKDKKERKQTAKSKYSDGPECLIKTVLPAKVAASGTEQTGKSKKGKSREVVVHEFEKTTRFPTFLKASEQSHPPADNHEFVEGKGWVDQDGKVIESVKTRSTSRALASSKRKAIAAAEDAADTTSSSGSSSEEVEEEASNYQSEQETSVDDVVMGDAKNSKPIGEQLESPRPKSSGSGKSLSIKIPPVTPAISKVHPLEALYKRAKQNEETPAQAPEAKPFTFFSTEHDDAPPSQPPMTPFTREDFEWRNIRSAAPTPDTAHPNKTFKLWPRDDEKEDDIEEADEDENEAEDIEMLNAQETATTTTKSDGDPETNDFQKWFWENRGDLNRSWKKRRKQAAKDKRYRENRARSERAI